MVDSSAGSLTGGGSRRIQRVHGSATGERGPAGHHHDQQRRPRSGGPRGLPRVDPLPSGRHVGSRPERNVPMRVNGWSRSRLRLRRDDGATAVIVVLTLLALLGVIVLTVDVGQLLFKRRAMVNASDAAALAAAQSCAGLADSDSPDAMADAFAANNVSSATRSSEHHRYGRLRRSAVRPRHRRVRHAAGLFFAGVLGFDGPASVPPPRPRPDGDPRAARTRSRSWSTRGTTRGAATSRRALRPVSTATSGSTTISSTVRRSVS